MRVARFLYPKALNALVAWCGIFTLALMANSAKAIPLADQILKSGKSRFVEKPDYLFKVLEAVQFNSGYKTKEAEEIMELIRRADVLNLSSDELYELDRQARRHLEPAFHKIFPGEIDDFNLLFVDGVGAGAMVVEGQRRSSIPTILLERKVLDEMAFADTLVGLSMHEAFHVRHSRRVAEHSRVRQVKGPAEEDAADDFATWATAEAGYNPLGYSLLMERLIPPADKSSPNATYARHGWLTHPPTETRVTQVNAKIEKASERRSFPPLLPLLSPFEQIAKLAPGTSTRVEFQAATAGSLAEAVAYVAWFSDKSAAAADVRAQILAEMARIRARVSPGNFAAWKANDVEGVAVALAKAWDSLPVELRAEKAFQDAFAAEDARWHKFFADFGMAFVSLDERQRDFLLRVSGLKAGEPLPALDDSTLEDKHLSYSVFTNPALYQNAFTNYISLAPSFYAVVELAVAAGQSAPVELSRLREYLILGLHDWANLQSTATPYQKVVADFAAALDKDRLDLKGTRKAFATALEPLTIGTWNSQIAALKIPDYAKLAFFPSVDVDQFKWRYGHDYYSLSEFDGVPLFSSSMPFVLDPAREGQDFSRFLKGLAFLDAIASPSGKLTLVPKTANEYSGFLGVRSVRDWYLKSINSLHLTEQDAFTLLTGDRYWETTKETDKPAYKNLALRLTDRIFHWDDVFSAWKKIFDFRTRYRVRRDVAQEVDSFFAANEFYTRREYQLDPKQTEQMQAAVYTNLKNNGAVPNDFASQVKLWMRFAKRGVTGFTDEWAEYLITRIENEPEVAAQTERVRSMYFANFVWDLKLRERLALVVFAADGEELKPLIAQPASRRERALRALLKQLRHEFPESSEERLFVADRIAERLRASREETTLIMREMNQAEKDIPDLQVRGRDALGIRFYSQLFGELQNSSQENRLEMLDFFLGKTDRVPYILHANFRREDEEKREPLLFHLRRSSVKPFRLRRAFQALSLVARTVMLDPLFVGARGLLANEEGKKWVVDNLVPEDALWRGMAVDLVDGYREAQIKFGQGHLKTLFISYLVACSVRDSRGVYTSLFPYAETQAPAETLEGKILRYLFSANAALTKIGQRVHSANILRPDINRSLESLKESAARVLREDQFAWLENARVGADDVELGGERGNASVKVVVDAKVEGEESVAYLIKPNAYHRGQVFFTMLEYAIDYAIARGHNQLRLIQPMVTRAKSTFQSETDLRFEREAAARLAPSYAPGPTYGNGYQFTTPEFLETAHLWNPEMVAAVKKIQVRRLSDLDESTQREIGQAIAEKEAAIHQQDGEAFDYNKDAHEGNFLQVTDAELLARLGVTNGKLILAIDFAQVSRIEPETRSAILDAAAGLAALQLGMLGPEPAAVKIAAALNRGVMDDASVTPAQVEAHLGVVMEGLKELKPGEAMSRLLSYMEADGAKVCDKVWDYLTAVATMQTWERLDPENAFAQSLVHEISSRCLAMLLAP